ncbi:hypothetical protein B0H63DRAFT_529509 [Podospora didyma]|uniref:Uncharacterized protein n=1 Tax=Podospora didyma TaxID=330526 RepID=A0AAE0K0G3_9PEZI|nr:hypothetical protein B0H63DRAFT_529509 [Podospora didyma]
MHFTISTLLVAILAFIISPVGAASAPCRRDVTAALPAGAKYLNETHFEPPTSFAPTKEPYGYCCTAACLVCSFYKCDPVNECSHAFFAHNCCADA